MKTKSAFLLARYAEEDAEAHEAIAERNRVTIRGEEPDWTYQAWPDLGTPAVLVGGERAVADVAAKRSLVLWLNDVPKVWVGPGDRDFVPGDPDKRDDHVLTLLVQPYAQHPDFDPDWLLDTPQ